MKRLISLLCILAMMSSFFPAYGEELTIDVQTPADKQAEEADAAGEQATPPDDPESKGGDAVFGIMILKPKATEEPDEPVRLEVSLDFSAYDPALEGAEPLIRYDMENALVTLDILRVLRGGDAANAQILLQSEAEDALSAIRTEELSTEETDFGTEMPPVRFEDGRLALTGDGALALTDGVNTVAVKVSGYEALLARHVESRDVAIDVKEGFVPAGASPALEALDGASAAKLAETYLAPQPAAPVKGGREIKGGMKTNALRTGKGETEGDSPASAAAVGYAAFELSIVSNGEEIGGKGEYAVTMPLPAQPGNLVPRGARQKNVAYTLYHLHDGSAEILDADVKDGTLAFTTSDFSTFILRYTVDFEYVNPETGETYAYTLTGGDDLRLSELLTALGIEADLAGSAAAFSDEKLIGLTPVTDQAGETADWLLSSLLPFDTEEKLAVTLANGAQIILRVTDEQIVTRVMDAAGDTYEITVTYDRAARLPADARLEVRELTDEERQEYLDRAAQALEAEGFAYAKLFDIAITDEAGARLQPAAPVEVAVRLLDAEETGEDFAVLHFEDGQPEEMKAETQGDTVTFAADGFSVYAIVSATLSKTVTTSDGLTYDIRVTYKNTAGIPMTGTELLVSEILEGDAEYGAYVSASADKLALKPESIGISRVFDIRIVDEKDHSRVYEPRDAVEVSITLVGTDLEAYKGVDVLHFADSGAKAAGLAPDDMESAVDGETVRFTTDSFSVYVVVGYTLETLVEASDGNTYRIVVEYDENAGIPMDGTELLVREVLPDTDEYDFYRGESLKALNTDDDHLALSRAFDIKIVDAADHTKVYEPQSEVSVSITLVDATLTDYADISVLHFEDDASVTDVDASIADVDTVQFSTDSFSVYAVNGSVHVATFYFYTLGEYLEYEPYYLSTDAETPAYILIVRAGERPVAPQNLVNPQDQEATFAGWFIGGPSYSTTTPQDLVNDNYPQYDFSETLTLEQDETYHLYAKFSHFYYVIFHDQYDQETGTFPVAFTRRFDPSQAGEGWFFEPSQYSVAYQDPANIDDTQMVFVGWSATPITSLDPNNNLDDYGYTITPIPTDANGRYWVYRTEHLYPIFQSAKWVNYYTGPSGSHVTYFTDRYYLNGEGPERLPGSAVYDDGNGAYYPAMTRDPAANGQDYAFEGWYVGATVDANSGEVDVTNAVQIADAEGTLIQNASYPAGGVSVVESCSKNENRHIHIDNSTVTFYAHWVPQTTASYTVVVSTLKAISSNDNPLTLTQEQKSYEFAESFVYTGTIGDPVTWDSQYTTLNDYESYNALHGTSLTAEENDTQNPYHAYYYAGTSYDSENPQTIAADGSTTIFVYYDWTTMPDYSGMQWTLKFVDSMNTETTFPIVHGEATYQTKDLSYGTTLADYLPADPVSGISPDGLTFKGWYADEACTAPVALTAAQHTDHPSWTYFETMPATDITIYAGWNREWFLIKIDPNYGELYKLDNSGNPTNGTGSTWMWKEYGDSFQEYTTVKRDYVESDAGSWYYVKKDRTYYNYPDYWIGSAEDNNSDRQTYYTQTPSEATELTTFKYDPNVYRYAGWYEVLFDDQGNEIGEANERYNFEHTVDHNITLRLRWMKTGVFYLKYDAGEGELTNEDESEVLYLELDGDTYSDDADVLVTRIAEAPEGYEFVGWRIRQDDSGTIYTPGTTFHLLSSFMATVQGKRTVFLDAVYVKVSTVSVVYHANGGVMDTAFLNSSDTAVKNTVYGHPVDTTYTSYQTDFNAGEGTATVSQLSNNDRFVLSNVTSNCPWLTRDAAFAGWCEAEAVDDAHPLLTGGGEYRIGVNEGEDINVHLYAIWDVSVTFHLNAANASFGSDLWDNPPYMQQVVNEENVYIQSGVHIGGTIDWPPHDPVYTDGSQTFLYWATKDDQDNYTKYDFDQRITGDLDLYAYWGNATLSIKVLNTSLNTFDYAPWTTNGDDTILLTTVATDPKELYGDTPDASLSLEEQARQKGWKQYSGNTYILPFVTVLSNEDPIKYIQERPIQTIRYNAEDGKIYLKMEGESEERPLAEYETIYYVYYLKRKINIHYVELASDGKLYYLDGYNTEDGQYTNANDHILATAPRDSENILNGPGTQLRMSQMEPLPDNFHPEDPTQRNNNNILDWLETGATPHYNNNGTFQYYCFALGTPDATGAENLFLKTNVRSATDTDRPYLRIRNTWAGFQFARDNPYDVDAAHATWRDCEHEISLYVVFYTEMPTFVTFDLETIGLASDQFHEFEFDYWIDKISLEPGTNYGTVIEHTFTTRNGVDTSDYVNPATGYTYLYHGASSTDPDGAGAITLGNNHTFTAYLLTEPGQYTYRLTVAQRKEAQDDGFTLNFRNSTHTGDESSYPGPADWGSDKPWGWDAAHNDDLIYVYTAMAPNTDPNYSGGSPDYGSTHYVNVTETRTSVDVELHVALISLDGAINIRDDLRSSSVSPYTISVGREQTTKIYTALPASSFLQSSFANYAEGAVVYGWDEHHSEAHQQGSSINDNDAVNIVNQFSDDVYLAYLPESEGSDLYHIYIVNEAGDRLAELTELGHQMSHESVDGAPVHRLYYLFYPKLTIHYVWEDVDGSLHPIRGSTDGNTVIDAITYDGALLSLNGQMVTQHQYVSMSVDGMTISQTVGRDENGNPYFNIPPVLDNGTAKLDLVYYELGARPQWDDTNNTPDDPNDDTPGYTIVAPDTSTAYFPGNAGNGFIDPNTNEIYASGITETLELSMNIKDNKLTWKFRDEPASQTISAWPVVYAIYRERGYNLTISKTVPEDTGYNEPFTVTVESMSINRDHYDVDGTGYSTIDATPAVLAANGNSGTPGKITFTVKDGDAVTIVGLGTGDYTVTETGNENFILTATVVDTQDTNATPASVVVTQNSVVTLSEGNTLDADMTLALTNMAEVICRVDDQKFYTLSSAVKYIEDHDPDLTATIEMLVPEYLMPASDMPVIPSFLHVTITTAPKNTLSPGDENYDATNQITTDEPAIIRRKDNSTGPMFRNLEELILTNITLDGNRQLDSSNQPVPYSSALINNEGTLRIQSGALLKDADSSGEGGAIYGYKGTVSMTGGSIENCSAKKGGAIYAAAGTVEISGGTICDNTADEGGAIYYAGEDKVTVSGGNIGTIDDPADPATRHGNTARNGGAIYMASSTIEVTGGNIQYNKATGSGGGIYAHNAYVNVSGIGNDTSKYPRISNNTAGENGGAVCMETLTFKLMKGYMQNNSAANGGAVWSNTGSVEISGGVMSDNQATGTAAEDPENPGNTITTGGCGGAVYTNESEFKMTDGQVQNNTAYKDGGAIYAEVGSVTYKNETGKAVISGNTATNGSGGGIYASTGTVTMTNNARLLSNTATSGNGGALYVGSGAASLTSAQIGKPSAGNGNNSDGNQAINGSGVFVNNGTVTINGGVIRNNVASEGGAVGVGSADARIYFLNNLVIQNNNMTVSGGDPVASNVYLNFDTDAILNFQSLGSSAYVGIYVSDDPVTVDGENTTVLEQRGVPSTRFGVYVETNVVTNKGKIINDRTPNLIVSNDATNKKLFWVRNFHIKVYYVADYTKGLPFGNTDYTTKGTTPFYEGSSATNTSSGGRFIRKADGTPPSFENAASEVANDIRNRGTVAPTDTAVFGNVFVQAGSLADMHYDDYLTRIDWNTGDNLWHFTKRDGEDLLGTDNTSTTKTLIFIYTEPYYLSIENNHPDETLVITYLGVKVKSTDNAYQTVINSEGTPSQTGYGYVFARDDAIQDELMPVGADDLVLEPGESIRILLPGGKGMPYTLTGKYYTTYDPTDPTANVASDTIEYDRRRTTANAPVSLSTGTEISASGFTINGDGSDTNAVTTSDVGQTHEIIFYSDRQICRVVVDSQITDSSTSSGFLESGFVDEHAGEGATEGNWEYTFRSPKQAYQFIETNRSAFTSGGKVTAKIEMLTDYMIPASEVVSLTTGGSGGDARDITFQTAVNGYFRYKKDQTNAAGTQNADLRATVSRGPGNNASFIQAASGTTSTSKIDGVDAVGTEKYYDYVDTLVLKNLIFDGKNFGGDNISGGIARTKEWNVEIDSVDFRNCRAQYGGGVYIESVKPKNKNPLGHLTVTNSSFTNCTSTHTEDKYGGGAIWTSMRRMTLTGCRFDSCEGNRQAGAVFHFLADNDQNYATTATVTNCTFNNCLAKAAGSMELGARVNRVTGCEFRNSTATERNGGALNVWTFDSDKSTKKSYLYLDHCTFENCYCLYGTDNNGNGGAFRSTATYNTITNCTFINALGTNGGAINIYNKSAVKTTVAGCTFNGCTAKDSGGALYCQSKLLYIGFDPDDTTITGDTIIRNCIAVNKGGAIYHSQTDTQSITSVQNAAIDTCYSSGSVGGGVYTSAFTVSVTDSTVENCYTVAENMNGGGLYLKSSTDTTFSNATIRNNTATGLGGGVFHEAKGTFKVTGSTISGNNAQGTMEVTSNGVTYQQSGGGIYTKAVTFNLENSTVSDNQAAGSGGGICQNYDNTSNGSMIVDGATVTGNISGGMGGGLYTLTNMILKGETTVTGNRLTTGSDTAENAAGVYLRDGVSLSLGAAGGTAAQHVFNITNNRTVDGTLSDLRLPDKDQYENDQKVNVYCGVDGEVRVVNAKKKLTPFGLAQGALTDPAGFTDGYKVFWAEDSSLYGIIHRQDTTHKVIIWGGDPICKITDGNGRLLYIDNQKVRPAVFDRLDALTTGHTSDTTTTSAFSTLRTLDTPGTYLYYADGTPYNGSVYQVKMLIEEYDSEYYMEVTGGTNRTVTLTTAGAKDSLYPYRGRANTVCTIARSDQMDTGHAMVTAKANFTLTNIKLDGNIANVTATGDTRIIKAACDSADPIIVTLGQKAYIQNAETTGNGGGVYLNNDAKLVVSGGSIRNCKAANGGGVYIDGTKGTMTMSVGTITKCEATQNGGGVYFNSGEETLDANSNTIGVIHISGGTISRCTAVDGGGIYMNTGARHLYMSGGSIAQNSVTGKGGGIAVGNNDARITFSGEPYVYQNTSTSEAVTAGPASTGSDPFYMVYDKANNVYMDQGFTTNSDDPDTVIVSRGLTRNASVGVYVPGDSYDSGLYGDHGAEIDPFATFVGTSTGGMNCFINDRNGMKGGQLDNQDTLTDKKIYWRKIYSLSITKIVLSDDPTDQNSSRYYPFEVELTGSIVSNNVTVSASSFTGIYGNVSFNNGKGYFSIQNGETKVIDLLPLGFGYKVTELLPPEQAAHFTTTTENDKGLVKQDYDASHHPYAEGTMDTNTKFNYPVTFYNLHAVCKIVGITTDPITGLELRELLYVYDSDTAKYIPAVYSSLVTAFARVNTGESRTWYYQDASGVMVQFHPDEYSIEMLVPRYEMEGPAALQSGQKATLTTADRDAGDGFPYVGGSVAAEIDRAYKDDSMITVDGGADLTLGRIILDGAGSAFPVSTDGDIVQVKSGSALTVGDGTTLQNAKTSGRGAAVYIGQGGKMYISGGPVFTNNVNTRGNERGWLTDSTHSEKKNGDDASYYPNNGSYIPMDIYIAGYENTHASSLVVTGNITSGDGAIAVWAQKMPHYIQNQQFALMDANAPAGGYTGLTAFRNAYPDWKSENPKITDNGTYYLYGIARDGKVYWSGCMDLSVSKTVTGDFADLGHPFTFTVSGLDNVYSQTIGCDYLVYESADGANWTPKNGGSGKKYADAEGKITFELKHHEKIVISVPRGSVITVTEANGYYTASYRIGNGEAQSGHAVTQYAMSADTAIAFTNTLNAAAPTGVSIRAVPFTALMLAGLLLFAVALTGKRRGKEDG